MSATIVILGSSAATPTNDRSLSAHLLETEGHSLLFDCAEGTQFQLKRFGRKNHRIQAIFISHLHGDHFFGLPGLISSMNLSDRTNPLQVFGAEGLQQAVDLYLQLSETRLKFPIEFVVLTHQTKMKIYESDNYEVFAFPLKHRITTYGYLWQQKPLLLNVNKEFVRMQNPALEWFTRIKQGEDYVDEQGIVFPNHLITESAKKANSYAYCSDTAYFEELADWVKGVSLLYHESTFLEVNQEDAIQKFHSTAKQAASIARLADADRLLLGHFSARYKDVQLFKEEAEVEFADVILAVDGMEIDF
jgi:ribonuclease Z